MLRIAAKIVFKSVVASWMDAEVTSDDNFMISEQIAEEKNRALVCMASNYLECD